MYRAISLFSGCGGLDLGLLESGGFQVSLANDHFSAAVKTYRHNIGDHIVCSNISALSRFPEADVVVGGPPCQGFSSANPHRGVHDERNWLFTEYLRVLKAVRPKAFLMENVSGIRTLERGRFYATMKRDFEQADYSVSDALLDAVDFGAPQRRVRNILVGVRNDLNVEFSFPAPNSLPGVFGGHRTVGDALFHPPVPPDAQNHEMTKSTELNVRRIRLIPEGGSMADCPPELQNNSDLKRAMRRLDRQQPSYTVVHNNCDHFYHPTEDRRVTIREMARLQGFPDSFLFFGSKSEQSIQVANAVPIPLARSLGEAMHRLLEVASRAAA